MLTFLMNRWNVLGDRIPQDVAENVPGGVGISAELPRELRVGIAAAAPVLYYDSGKAIGEAIDPALDEAQELSAQAILISVGNFCDAGARVEDAFAEARRMANRCRERGIRPVWTNRRPFLPDVPVCAEKVARLSQACDAKIAMDVGMSHAYCRALEDYFDLWEWIEALLVNDNYGRDALFPVGHPDYDAAIAPDDMRQPGYGTVPYVKLMDNVRRLTPEIQILINGCRWQGASLDQVLLETRTLFAGRVFINPAGGKIGMGANGRIMI